LATPKTDELIANRYRAGSKAAAEQHFENGMAEFMTKVAASQQRSAPSTIYYAYRATEAKDGKVRSTGWDTFLQAVLDAGLQVTATWPMRTELSNRLVASGTNALASSIVLSCRPRAESAALASTGEFLTALRAELPDAVRLLQSGNIAPVDMAQSTIGPGIKIFSRYAKVVEADGTSMSVSDALLHVNTVLGEILDGESTALDRDTRFAVAWFELHGYNPGPAGDADSQARSKGTTVAGVVDAGIAESGQGKVRLKERTELSDSWSPTGDDRLTVWETTQYLIAALDRSESEAAHLLGQLGGVGDQTRSLAYMLFKKATDKGWADEAAAYNRLITAWPNLADAASHAQDGQQTLM
jgi:putative DNA methylase